MKRVLLVVGIGLLLVGGFGLMSSPTAEGYDPDVHGGNICSSAILEVFGVGSKDTDSAAPVGGGPSIGIEDCNDPARRQVALATCAVAVGVVMLLLRRRLPKHQPEAVITP